MTGAPFLDRTVTVGGESVPCRVHLPAGHAGIAPLPALLFLHGSGERGRDNVRQTQVGLGPVLRRHPERYPMVVVMPQAPPDRFWAGATADAALAAFLRLCAEYPVDRGRLLLTGLSMGGHGAWYLAYRNPGLFAALLPVCGWVSPIGIEPPGTARVVPEADGASNVALAQRLAALPVHLVHGHDDPVVPVQASRDAASALRAAGAPVTYAELPGVGHNAWEATYAAPLTASWLLAQRRAVEGRAGAAG